MATTMHRSGNIRPMMVDSASMRSLLRIGLMPFVLSFFTLGCHTTPKACPPTHPIVFNVRAFGATGDGKTMDTPAINQAIAAAVQAGGGTVWLGAGQYLCASMRLQSNVCLYLDQGATIVAAEGRVYDPPEANKFDQFQDFGHTHWHNSLIWGEHLENVSILGPGKIFG